MSMNISFSRQTLFRTLLFCAFILPLMLYTAVVFLSPDDVYSRYSFIREFTDSVHGFISNVVSWIDIHKHARSTDFVEVAKVSSSLAFVCIVWMIIGFQIAFVAAEKKSRLILLDNAALSKKQIYGGATWMPLFGAFLPFGFYCLAGDPSSASGLTTKSVFGYFFMSVLTIIFAGISVGFWPISIYSAFKLFFFKGKST